MIHKRKDFGCVRLLRNIFNDLIDLVLNIRLCELFMNFSYSLITTKDVFTLVVWFFLVALSALKKKNKYILSWFAFHLHCHF